MAMQVEVKELSAKRFVGCLRIGVTSLPLEVVAGWKKWTADTDSTGQSTVLDRTDTGRLCVCSKGSVSRERERVRRRESLREYMCVRERVHKIVDLTSE